MNKSSLTLEEAKKQSKELINSISKNNSVMRLARNPLMMTIISTLHYQSKELPNNRFKLYEACAETFVKNWITNKINSINYEVDENEVMYLLSSISFYMHEARQEGISENELKRKFKEFYIKSIDNSISEVKATTKVDNYIKFLSNQTGLFYCDEYDRDEFGNYKYKFLHLTFQEYFAAIHLEQYRDEDNLEKYFYNPRRWLEIFRLAVAKNGFDNNYCINSGKFVELILNLKDAIPELGRRLAVCLSMIIDNIPIHNTTVNMIFSEFIKFITNCEIDDIINIHSRRILELLLSKNGDRFLEYVKDIIHNEEVKNRYRIILILLPSIKNDKDGIVDVILDFLEVYSVFEELTNNFKEKYLGLINNKQLIYKMLLKSINFHSKDLLMNKNIIFKHIYNLSNVIRKYNLQQINDFHDIFIDELSNNEVKEYATKYQLIRILPKCYNQMQNLIKIFRNNASGDFIENCINIQQF